MALKLLADLAAGDRVVKTKTVKAVWTDAGDTKRVAVYEDDTTESWDLTGEPSIEIVDG